MKNLLTTLFKWLTKPYPAPSLPKNTRIYCIGDIHGCYDLLKQLTNRIEEDTHGFIGHVIVIYLGDFIDRGTSSKKVIDFLLTNRQSHIEYVFLRGNHEQMLLDFLTEGHIARAWLSYGGIATLASYEVYVAKIPTKPEDFRQLQKQLSDNLPAEHYQFLRNTLLCYSLGDYFFVHAGINPNHPLAKQMPEDLLSIRNKFTRVKTPFEKIIVHGHTITATPELLANRMGIDTGAYKSGVLTCLVLEANQQRIIQIGI